MTAVPPFRAGLDSFKPGSSIVAQSHLGRVVLWMTGALLSFSGSALAIRALGKQLNTFEILTIRSGTGLFVLLVLAALRPELRRDIAPRYMAFHLARNTTHFVGQYSWALAVTLLPFATVFALEFTTPAWVALLAALILGERMTRSRLGSVVLGFLGVLVIVRPGLASFQPMALLVLFAALAFAISLIVTKQLTNRVSTFAIIFWMNTIQLPLALAWPAFVAATGGPPLFVSRMGLDLAVPTITLAIVGLTSHYCLTQAFRSGDATVVVPMDFLRIPLIAVVGWTFYGEPLDALVFAGAALIIAGILWNLRAESRRRGLPVAAGTEEAQAAEP
jgi:drug/metabolite transporter (DMT)-like permease